LPDREPPRAAEAATASRSSLLDLERGPDSDTGRAPVLVIGVGNRDRGDDAIGPLLLEGLRARLTPDKTAAVELLEVYQLQPEHALDLRRRRRVIVVDASATAPTPFAHAPVDPAPDAVITTHSLSPAALAAVHERLYGCAPALELLAVRGECFDLGTPLSAAAAANMQVALHWLHHVARLTTWFVRPADRNDLPALRRVYAEAVRRLAPAHYSPAQVATWAGFAAEDGFAGFVLDVPSFVAVVDGCPVGFCGIAPDGHVASLYVHPDHCRLGIGGGLLSHALAACPAPAAGRWFAEASVLSRPLFERLGFRQTGVELAARDGVGFERYLMAREASDAAAPAGSS
jgi:hydrogenase maturation protease